MTILVSVCEFGSVLTCYGSKCEIRVETQGPKLNDYEMKSLGMQPEGGGLPIYQEIVYQEIVEQDEQFRITKDQIGQTC